ncbi:type IV secretory system conjugative DNA transfer family protein [Streptomyces sp. NRRL WC-3549]|uniref:type IV secretory system conjugative DNA transfer family protein n=1 Tax=Streptomyces sp. NRRL WC-3549 TaxID=1463925 RepID=UPI0004CA71F6|nr:type IV secretory system conjugative DNA transfer family protein [Streptomyces sp. NRRL WC-3549]
MARPAPSRTEHGGQAGGIPDGLLIGLLSFLFGITVLAWTATGLAGLFAHGGWPSGVTFTRTPLALRALASAPHDLAAAWPDTPKGELSGYGLFWGLFIGELMVLIVLTIFVMGVVTRGRLVRRHRAAEAAQAAKAPETAETTGPGRTAEMPAEPAPGQRPSAYRPAAPRGPEHPPEPAPASPPPSHAPPASQVPPAASAETITHAPAPTPTTPPAAHAETAPLLVNPAAVPGPRGPVLLYGTAATRRPTALQAVQDAEGPALVVTSDPTLWAETKDARAKLGPVLVYDPGHLCDTPGRLHWSPTAGCEDPAVATERAAALLAPVRPRARVDAAVADTAQTLLQCWLHAAAVDGRPFRQVHRWASKGSAHEPVRLLRTHPKAASGLAGLLESALTAYPERRDAAQDLTGRAFAALSSVHVRDACTPNRNDALVLESFAAEGGTLYVVGESIEDPRHRPGAMPLLTALASHVVEHGRRMAARSTDGRLDPPMALVLDDVAAVAPLPQLPELLRTGRDQGMPALVLLRSQEQARSRWQSPLHAPEHH